MPTLVSTGQITIVDTNDARPITSSLTSNLGTQQIYSKDNDTITFTPSWFTANANTGVWLTAKSHVGTVGGSTDITPILSNRKFALTLGGAALTSASTYTSFVNDSGVVQSTPFSITHDGSGSVMKIHGNLLESVAVFVVYFEGDYTDPATGLVSHVIAQITLNTLKTGTNAVYILTRGNETIEQATGTIKSVTAISADLIRSSGVDATNLSYKWYTDDGSAQVSTSYSGYATKFGLKTVASGVPPSDVGELGVNIPTSGAGNAHNTLVISETAVVGMEVFRVDITDSADAKTYSQYFTIYDVSDKYDIKMTSSSGDKLQNGIGNTTLTPSVYYGAAKVTNLTGWSFTYYFYDKDGKRAAFVDTAKIATAGGAPVTANTTGASATINYTGTSYAFAAGDIVKVVKANGDAFYYEVASSTTNVVTIRAPSTNVWLTFTNYPAPSAGTDFVGGKLYGCTAQGIRTVAVTPWVITVTGDEIDVKGNIVVEANRP